VNVLNKGLGLKLQTVLRFTNFSFPLTFSSFVFNFKSYKLKNIIFPFLIAMGKHADSTSLFQVDELWVSLYQEVGAIIYGYISG
jgi:hypothetical protein